jgi:glycerate kinase
MARGWRKTRPDDQLELLPMSDGGDGFGSVVGSLLCASEQTVSTVDAAHRPIRARWWWEAKCRTAIVESAKIIGLAMLPPGKFHPFELDTFGLGTILRAAARKGCRHCMVGIGGSATNDGGFGVARALEWRFLDRSGRLIERWVDLERLDCLQPPDGHKPTLHGMKVTVAVDVQNPLLGPHGASRIFGPQKGLGPRDLPLAEGCLKRLASAARQHFKKDLAKVPGAGAAGGLGFGLFAFLGARAESGVEIFARCAKLSQRLRAVDLVITGEGSMDKSTLMGKGVGEIARRCRRIGIPCLGLSGILKDQALLRRRFVEIHCLTPEMTSPEKAMRRPAFWLEKLTMQVAQTGKWRKS